MYVVYMYPGWLPVFHKLSKILAFFIMHIYVGVICLCLTYPKGALKSQPFGL